MDLHFLRGKEKNRILQADIVALVSAQLNTEFHRLLYFLIYVPEPSLETEIFHSSSAEGERTAAEGGPGRGQVAGVESQAVCSWC